MTQLAYTSSETAKIMCERGYNDKEVRHFLRKHQNPSGYIQGNMIPKPRKTQ